jgi:TPR repeat protein
VAAAPNFGVASIAAFAVTIACALYLDRPLRSVEPVSVIPDPTRYPNLGRSVTMTGRSSDALRKAGSRGAEFEDALAARRALEQDPSADRGQTDVVAGGSRGAREVGALLRPSVANFADPEAQYQLGRAYLDGAGVVKDPEEAVRWFETAAQQGQYRAQALLGTMLVEGRSVPRDLAHGLSWLALAKDAAGPDESWIVDAYTGAYAQAGAEDRRVAQEYTTEWLQHHRR